MPGFVVVVVEMQTDVLQMVTCESVCLQRCCVSEGLCAVSQSRAAPVSVSPGRQCGSPAGGTGCPLTRVPQG